MLFDLFEDGQSSDGHVEDVATQVEVLRRAVGHLQCVVQKLQVHQQHIEEDLFSLGQSQELVESDAAASVAATVQHRTAWADVIDGNSDDGVGAVGSPSAGQLAKVVPACMHEHEAVQQDEQATEEFDSLEGYDGVQEQGPSEPIADVGLGFSEAGFDVGIDVNVVDHERAFEEAAVCEVEMMMPIGIEVTTGTFRSDDCDDGVADHAQEWKEQEWQESKAQAAQEARKASACEALRYAVESREIECLQNAIVEAEAAGLEGNQFSAAKGLLSDPLRLRRWKR